MKSDNRRKVSLLSLGCSKNLVDSEMILATFPQDRWSFTTDYAEADLIIINTCGFIEDAKKEAVAEILKASSYHPKKLVAVGCFVERYIDELKREMPEVDLFVPIREYAHLHEKVAALFGESAFTPMNPLRRILSGPSWSAYLRISEGCNNGCAFCAIPKIRGPLKSRPLLELLEEAKMLREKGVKELNIVSQDPMHYGADFKDGTRIIDLLRPLDEMGFRAIRLFYMYPDEILDEDLEFIRSSKSVLPYFDIPVQSGSDRVLRKMNRHGSRKEMIALFKRIRELFPEAVLRTTLIAGFPEETNEDHEETLSFIKEVRFDHLGVFAYSKEEGTAGYYRKGQCHEATKQKRLGEIMDLARHISYEENKKRIGQEMDAFVLSFDKKMNAYSVRTYFNAPDDIDGAVYLRSDKTYFSGDEVRIRITNAGVYDLLAEEA